MRQTVGIMAVRSTAALRLALSASLPLILVAYLAWQGGLHTATTTVTTLYSIWSSAQNGGSAMIFLPLVRVSRASVCRHFQVGPGFFLLTVSVVNLKKNRLGP